MNTLKTLIGASGLIIALGGWSAANAATYTFNFAVTNGPSESLNFIGSRTDGGTDTLSVTVSGGPSQRKRTAIVESWAGNGLGVMNDAYKRKGNWRYNDEHYVDNKGSDDFALFDFGQEVKVNKIVLQAWGDTDITVTSGSVWETDIESEKGNLVGKANGNKLYEFDLSSLNVPNDKLWRIFAKIGGERDGLDKFKIYSLTASTVPIPAAVWLFGSALLGMVGIGYRRQARQI